MKTNGIKIDSLPNTSHIKATAPKILPCPFCGGTPTIDEYPYDEDLGIEYQVLCSDCGAETVIGDRCEVVRMWNARA